MQGGGLSHLEANCLVIGGFKWNTHSAERVLMANKILDEKIPHSRKHFGSPIVQFLQSSVIRVPLKPSAPRAAIEQAVEEYNQRDDKPLVKRDDLEPGCERPVWVQAPMPPNRRRRNATLRRAEAYLLKHHKGKLDVSICWGTGSLKTTVDGVLMKLLQVTHEGVITYYATLRDKNVDKEGLQAHVTNIKNNVEQEPEY